jgi:hypothetical protein
LGGLALMTPVAARAGGEADFESGREALARGDHAAAAARFYQAALGGHAEAAYTLGLLCTGADGIPENKAEALKWMRQSAEQGYAPAQQQLGLWHLGGGYVAQSSAEAARWFRKAADGDDASAMYFLGTMYARGHGVERNPDWALRWLKHAKARGFPVPPGYLTAEGVERMGRKSR